MIRVTGFIVGLRAPILITAISTLNMRVSRVKPCKILAYCDLRVINSYRLTHRKMATWIATTNAYFASLEAAQQALVKRGHLDGGCCQLHQSQT